MTRSVVGPSTLRDPVAELALVRLYVRNPDWIAGGWAIPIDWFSGHQAHRLYAVLVERLNQGEDVSIASVCEAAGINPTIIASADVEALSPDVPTLARRLHRLAALRRLRLLAITVAHRAEQPDAEPETIAGAIRDLLDEATERCPVPRRRLEPMLAVRGRR